MAELCCMNIVTWAEQLFERRWLLVTLGIDGYVYPQLRYTIFDVVLLLWCFDGLIFSVVAIGSAVASRSISKWPFRTLLLYFALFAFLILGGTLLVGACRYGY